METSQWHYICVTSQYNSLLNNDFFGHEWGDSPNNNAQCDESIEVLGSFQYCGPQKGL